MKKLCSASYRAQQVSNAVILFAEGWHQTSGYTVWFERNMLTVFPPEFILYHDESNGPVLDVMTPFDVNTIFKASARVTSVVVHDANGRTEVEVEQTPDLAGVAEGGQERQEATCGAHGGGATTAITALKDGSPISSCGSAAPTGGGGGGGEVPYPFGGKRPAREAEGLGSTFEEAFDAAVRNLPSGGGGYPDQLSSVDVVSMGALYGGIVGHVGTRRVRVRAS